MYVAIGGSILAVAIFILAAIMDIRQREINRKFKEIEENQADFIKQLDHYDSEVRHANLTTLNTVASTMDHFTTKMTEKLKMSSYYGICTDAQTHVFILIQNKSMTMIEMDVAKYLSDNDPYEIRNGFFLPTHNVANAYIDIHYEMPEAFTGHRPPYISIIGEVYDPQRNQFVRATYRVDIEIGESITTTISKFIDNCKTLVLP